MFEGTWSCKKKKNILAKFQISNSEGERLFGSNSQSFSRLSYCMWKELTAGPRAGAVIVSQLLVWVMVPTAISSTSTAISSSNVAK